MKNTMTESGMKRLLAVATIFLTIFAEAATRAELLRAKFDSADTNYVFVVAHRADWRHHPENSISAIKGAIAMGADMVEIDVAKTKDGVFVLSHDGKLNRMTDKKGRICDLTLAEVKSARLKMKHGGAKAALTEERVPTLAEALEACRGQILVNIDKFNVDPKGITDVIQRLGVAKQVVLKGGGDYAWVKRVTGEPWKHVESRDFIYMPVIGSGKSPAELDSVRKVFAAWDAAPYAPPAYEVCIPGDAPVALFADFRASAHHPRIWVNTLWNSLANGHSESLRGAAFSPDKVWGHWVNLGVTIIQTDKPAALVKYLSSRARHTL